MMLFQKIFILSFIFSFWILWSSAQNPDLPKKEVVIYLNTGKQIKGAKLWDIHPGRIEYEKGGNLHDLAINEISGILYPDGQMRIIREGKVFDQSQPDVPEKSPATINSPDADYSKLIMRINPTERFVENVPLPEDSAKNVPDPGPSPEKKQEPEPPSLPKVKEAKYDCYTSFIRGKDAAKGGSAYYCLGCLPIFPINSLIANEVDNPKYIPFECDSRCYIEGYQAGRRKKQNQNLAYGGVTTLGLAIVLFFISRM